MAKIVASMEEAELEIDRAIEAQKSEESTAASDLSKVANYREELDKIKKENNDDGSTDSSADTADNSGDSDTGTADQDSGQTNSEGDGSDTSNSNDNEQGNSDGGAGESTANDGSTEETSSDDKADEVKEDTTEPSDANLEVAEEAIQVQATLVRMNNVLGASLDRGGISDSSSALAIESIINSMKARLGVPATPSGISMEAFDSISLRTVSTESLMSSVSDTVKRVWEAIVKFFKGIFAWVKEFLTGAKRSEQARAEEQRQTTEALMKTAKLELEEAVQKNIASKVYRARSVFLTDGDADIDFKQMYTISMAYQKQIEQFISSIEGISRRFANICSKLASNTVDMRLFDGLQINASDFRAMNLKEARMSTAMKLREENTMLCSEPTVGNRRFVTICSNEKYQPTDASSQHQINFTKMEIEDTARGGVFFTPNYQDLKLINDYISKVLIVDEKRLLTFFNRDISVINATLQKIINSGPAMWTTLIDSDGNSFAMDANSAGVICTELSAAMKLYSRTLINGTSVVLESFSKHISAMSDYVNTNIRMIENSVNSKKTGKTK